MKPAVKPTRRVLRWGPLCFCDPVLLCGALYVLLYFDASGFLRLGLAAAFLHEWGHIAAYLLLRRRFPCMDVTMTGFCMRTRGEDFGPGETLLLAAAGPGMNALLAAVWFGALDTPLYYLNNIVWELLGKGTGYIDKIAYSIYYAGLGTVV